MLFAPPAGSHGEGSAVFVSNLQWWTTDVELEALCAAYGHVVSIRFLDDKACGKSRGMAVVEFAGSDAATACIAGLAGCVAPCVGQHAAQQCALLDVKRQ
jgi:RNA recognition motif-containing protein